MGENRISNKSRRGTKQDRDRGMVIFDQLQGIRSELIRGMGLPVPPEESVRANKMPAWSLEILNRLQKTILKRVVKLIPKGQVNWRNYGKMIGLIHRFTTFINKDAPRIVIEEGLDELGVEGLVELLGKDRMRRHLVKMIGRPVADDESMTSLWNEAWRLQEESLKKIEMAAFSYLAHQEARATSLFLKGIGEGYTLFLDEECRFVGDRGRTDIYLELLAHQMEIERMRRVLPARTRCDLYAHLARNFKFPSNGQRWLNDICDEIGLGMKSVGAPHKFLRSSQSIAM